MNNFRPLHPKSLFTSRDSQQCTELPNPWMIEDELSSMRRQNSQRHPFLQNTPTNVQTPHLNQSHMPSLSNKNYIIENSCKMPGSNFTRLPNSNIFKSVPVMNESNYQSRATDKLPYNNSFSNVNMQFKNNEGPMYKDVPVSDMMNLQSYRNQSLSENISRPLYSDIRQSQERFPCMQNNETQFHSKYNNSQIFEGKGFPMINDKSLLIQSASSFSDKVSTTIPNNFAAYKQNFKSGNLFPAYAPKDTVESGSPKIVHSPGCNSDFPGKSNNFCDKTALSNRYPNTLQPFKERIDAYQESNAAEMNELFSQPNNSSSFMYDKESFKVPKAQLSPESFKQNIETVNAETKFSFSSENQQSCFQSLNEMPFQKSPNLQNLQIPEIPNSTASKDCLMQNTSFSVQSDNQNLKESFSSNSFNFETNLNVSDIADLLPGLDVILKEVSSKSEEVLPKNDLSKYNSAFDDDEWSKHSIPFIGDDNQASNNNIGQNNNNNRDFRNIGTDFVRRSEYELKTKGTNLLKSPVIEQTDNIFAKDAFQKEDASIKGPPTVHSALEEAIEMLVKGDPIVGLDFIIEFKKNIGQKDSFPFRCKLCNSAISRPSIIDHIVGSKHRMRYLKFKDEAKYEYIVSLKIEKAEKEAKIAEAAHELEKVYGSGKVNVNVDDFQKDSVNTENSFTKETESISMENVITLDKIPIGFEALSPQHDDTSNANFDLQPHLNGSNQSSLQKSTSNSTELKPDPPSKIPDSEFSLPGLSTESSSNFVQDTNFSLPQSDSVNSDLYTNSKLCVESAVKQVQQSMDSQVSEVKIECGSVKRSASLDFPCPTKVQKVEKIDEEVKEEQKQLELKEESDSPTEKKVFNPSIFDELLNCTISSEEEASVALRAINILMELYMRYKLQHVSLEVVETLMKSLQSRSSDKMKELIALLNDSKISSEDDKSSAVIKEDNVLMELDSVPQDKAKEASNEEQAFDSSNLELRNQGSNLSAKNATDNNEITLSLPSTVPSAPLYNMAASNATLSVSSTQTSIPVSFTTVNDTSKHGMSAVTDSTIMPQLTNIMNSQEVNPVCLKPPPFFKWPQTSEASSLPNPVSYANIQTNQSMMWSTAYQQPQLQYAQMPYYQGYGNTYTGTQAYPTQFPVLPQNSVQMNMAAAPPLPPPLPPPPPVPSDQVQSRYRNSNPILNKATSQSAILPGNIIPFSKPPPPPPPPLP